MKRLLTFVFAVLTACLSLKAQVYNPHDATEADILADIEAYIEDGMQLWNIPGTAISIIKDNQVVYAKGFGVKDITDPSALVNEHTCFKIGSVSKAFTPVIVAQLVDEGKLKWNDKVKDLLPGFKLKDKFATENFTVKDLFCHWSGLPGQAGTNFANLGFSRQDMLKLIAQIEPAYSFRCVFRYNTMFYSISALLVEKLTGKSWEENIRSRILVPLGMSETSMGGSGLMASENRAQSHTAEITLGKIEVEAIPYEHQPLHRLTEISAAGAIVSNVCDMTKWLQFQMGDGTFAGRRILSKKQMDEIHKGIGIARQTEESLTLYGYGWYVEQSAKGKLYWHTGSSYGHTAICGWIPELKLGFMVSNNSDGGAGFRRAVMRRIIDLYEGYPDTDYSAREYDAFVKAEQERKSKSLASAEESKFEEPLEPRQVVGSYENSTLGKAVITLEDEETLCITIGPLGWKHELENLSGVNYVFESDGHLFPVKFNLN
ncbi:MAG: beta-lactamase family protein, partial [Bacteroidales bacterium]|nr:beta-lactamase family protein [Bacteroidales bacterium]